MVRPWQFHTWNQETAEAWQDGFPHPCPNFLNSMQALESETENQCRNQKPATSQQKPAVSQHMSAVAQQNPALMNQKDALTAVHTIHVILGIDVTIQTSQAEPIHNQPKSQWFILCIKYGVFESFHPKMILFMCNLNHCGGWMPRWTGSRAGEPVRLLTTYPSSCGREFINDFSLGISRQDLATRE